MNHFRNAFMNLLKRTSASGNGGSSGGGGSSSPPGLGTAVTGIALISGLGLGVVGLSYSLVTVEPGHQGIVYSRFNGLNKDRRLTEGLNLLIPWFERAIVYDIRARPQQINSHSGSKDLQIVQISLRVLYRPDERALPSIYRQLGTDFAERVLPSIVNETTKAVVAQYNASELLTKRDVVSRQIRDTLTKRSSDFHILLDDVSITHLAFSQEYTAAVEAKQVAQQDSERAKYIVEKAIQEKRAIIVRAEGEAKSAELIGASIRDNPAFIQLRRIEASKDVANTIAASQNKFYLDADALLLNHLGEVTEEQGRQERLGPHHQEPVEIKKAAWF